LLEWEVAGVLTGKRIKKEAWQCLSVFFLFLCPSLVKPFFSM
jgi:hypothetical protein